MDRRMFTSVEALPDHGHGGLGKAAHSALTPPPGEAAQPELHLAFNTLPDPPLPLPGTLPYPIDPQAWAACGGDPATFLRQATASLRATPPAPKGTYDLAHQRLAEMTRVDAIVMVTTARMLLPDRSEAARALADNIVEGYYRDGDAAACPDARMVTTALGVDREGGTVVLVTQNDEDAEPTALDGSPDGELIGLLADVLDAQYSWTQATFAL